MFYTEDFEFEIKLKDRRLIAVVGRAEVTIDCDCESVPTPHPHIESIHVESAEQLYDAESLEGAEIDRDAKTLAEIESEIEGQLYHQLEAS